MGGGRLLLIPACGLIISVEEDVADSQTGGLSVKHRRQGAWPNQPVSSQTAGLLQTFTRAVCPSV